MLRKNKKKKQTKDELKRGIKEGEQGDGYH